VSRLNNAYGIPPGGHGHGGHDEGESQGDDEHHDDQGIEEDHGDELFTRIDLAQTVYQGKLLARGLEGFVQQVRIDLSRTEYGHRELEIAGDEREVGTRFDVTGNEARGEITHAPLAGWTGTLGLHYTDRDFAAEGLEAFVPPSDTRGLGIYLIEDLAIGAADLELGLRHDRQRITTSGLDAIDHDSVNASASLLYPLADSQRLGLILSRSERAPVAEELLAAGAHVAPRSYEVAHPELANPSRPASASTTAASPISSTARTTAAASATTARPTAWRGPPPAPRTLRISTTMPVSSTRPCPACSIARQTPASAGSRRS